MNRMVNLERVLFSNPVTSIDQYPSLDEMNLEIMKMESLASRERMSIYAYLRDWNGEWFTDIYVNHVKRRSLQTERFVIAKGYSMSEEDEKRFCELLMNPRAVANMRVCQPFIEEICDRMPELHLRPYTIFSHVFFHLYYCTHRSGIREQLFKIGLNEIAVGLESIEEYDILGTNVEDAFDIPLNMARRLNTKQAVLLILKSKENRLLARRIYEAFHNQINRFDTLNGYQYDYLKECWMDEIYPNMRVLRQLSQLHDLPAMYPEIGAFSDMVYQEFKKYRENWSVLGTYRTVFPQYPDINDSRRFLTLAKLLDDYVTYEGDLDISIRNVSGTWKEQYAYEDEDYEIVIPTCLKEILREADALHNCLHVYVYPIIRQETVIVFMHEKKEKKRACVCLEICENDICQARGICNLPLTEEQNQFVIAYAQAKGLDYSNQKGLDLFEDDGDEEWDDDFDEF